MKVKVKHAGMATKLLVLVLLAALAVALLSTQAEVSAAQNELDDLNRQKEALREANAALADAIAHSDDLSYLEDIARSELGLLEPGEFVFVDSSK